MLAYLKVKSNKNNDIYLFIHLFIFLLKADWQPKAEKHRFYKQKT